ncbi:MAG: hypothetical protein ACI92I_000721 [Acidimicrobiales bacterium]|jgi:hypothetical protein
MKNKTKALLIPIAAFAVTVTGASAFNSVVLENAGLDTAQITAFEQAHELRKEGDKEAARDVLVEAGVDMETMQAVRGAMKEHRQEMKSAIYEAVGNNDYQAFIDAIEGSPLVDIITSESDFELFVQAHTLRAEGDREEAKEIMEDLGFEGKMNSLGHKGNHEGDGGGGNRDGRFEGGRPNQ